MTSVEAIRKQAELEYGEELFRAAVEKHKEKLRLKRSAWDRVFPWKIYIVRKTNV
jgi:hypothetical protein